VTDANPLLSVAVNEILAEPTYCWFSTTSAVVRGGVVSLSVTTYVVVSTDS